MPSRVITTMLMGALMAYGLGCDNAGASGKPAPRAAEFRSQRLDEALESASALLMARGFTEEGPPTRGFLVERDAEVEEATMRAGSCYVIVVVGSSSLEDLELRVFDSDGAEVARTSAPGPESALQYCPTQSGTYYVGKRASTGNGLFATRVLRGPAGLDVRLDDLFRNGMPEVGATP